MKCYICGDRRLTDCQKLCLDCQSEEDRYNEPPCLECGAKNAKEAEMMCICSGDKDSCHGTHLWDD